ncbi:unnamed protein product [Prunus brigantina]
MSYRIAVTSSEKKEQGGKRHLDTKWADKGREAKVVQDGAKNRESKDKKMFSGCFLCQGPHRVKDCLRKQHLNAIMAKGSGDAEQGSSLQVSPMVLMNSQPGIPPEDPLGDDAFVQPMLGVIEVFVAVFALEPSEVFIDAFLSCRGILIEAIEDMVPNWDLNCGLEEMQLAALARCLYIWRAYLLDKKFVARTCVLHTHMYCTCNIRDEFNIYSRVLDEFDFELVYMTTWLRDFVEQVDELRINEALYDSSVSDPSESESEEEPWERLAIANILGNAMFEEGNEISEANEEPMEESEPWEESMADIIVISSDDEDEPMEESDVEMILAESSNDESMG